MDLPPLPEMPVPGRHRRRRPALAVIQSGRLSDLLALWLQLVRAAERGRSASKRTGEVPRQAPLG